MTEQHSPLKTTILLFLLSVTYAVAGSLTVIAVGDIMMGSDFPGDRLPPEQGNDLFLDVTDSLKSADLTLGNLESVLLTGGVCTKTPAKGTVYAFRTPPSYARHLVDAGFDFLNLANNHLNDFGYGGVESTIKTLDSQCIAYGGPGGKCAEFDFTGIAVAIACFATSPGTDLLFDIGGAQRKVAALSRENDITIVSFHGGGEGLKYLHTLDTFECYLGQPRGNVVEFARAVVDSGADLVWGHGPHVPRAIEIYKDRLLAYSLGNFCTKGFNIAQELGYAPMLKVALDSTGAFMHGRIISVLQTPGKRLAVDTLHRAAQLMKRLSAEDLPASAPSIMDDGTILRQVTDSAANGGVDSDF